MSENTVRKYLRRLEERGLIVTEPTEVITKTGEKRNGNLMFALRPIQEVIDEYYNRQLEEAKGAKKPQPQQPKRKKSGEGTTDAGKVGGRPYARGRAYREDHYDE